MRRHLIAALALGCLVPAFAAEPVAPAKEKGDKVKVEGQAEHHHLTAPELKKLIDEKKVTLLDCNGSESFAKGHIPGAIDVEASKANLSTLLPKEKSALVVAYCGGPKCHAFKEGVAAAKKLGYTKVEHFSGGLSGWTEAGYALEGAKAEAKAKTEKKTDKK